MHKPLLTLALGTSLFAAPALAQQAGHDAYHSEVAPSPAAPGSAAAAGGMGIMSRMQGGGAAGQGMGMMPDMRMGMMGCPMMQSGMGGKPAQAAQPAGDESVASLALGAVNAKMHRDMAIAMTGDADLDFTRAMLAHHQGAVDMAKLVLAFGEDPEVRALALAIVEAQETEIRTMEDWLAAKAPQ